ncbi:PREDICTED: uncharacterized protein LOC106820233 [Priapulus caudatus]|uniref:Uncharacterized protein LOC106820233 n=1 Tax=Priapulus caudatus TaxID=37621 RepID=A0ABM1F733_PRICU|nr:PREDICTED: uncharacterized protein LOC106820233 [Priapulus caudatus]
MSTRSKCQSFLEYLAWVARLWGILTAIGMWGVGVEICYDRHILGAFIVLAAIVVTVLETTFIVDVFFTVYMSNYHKQDESSRYNPPGCVVCWHRVLAFDYWRKGVLYTAFGAICFAQPYVVWEALINGVMLLILAVIHFIRTMETRYINRRTSELDKPTYDRFPDIEDVDIDIDGEMHIDFPSIPSVDESETLAEQDAILDV